MISGGGIGGGMGGGDSGVIDEIIVSGIRPGMSSRFGPGGMSTLTGPFTGGGIGSYGTPFGMGDFTPSIPTPVMPQFQEEQTFGQKAGETIKNFLKRLARVHPATATAAFAFDFVKNLQNAENPQDFVKGMLGQLAMRKVGGNLGLSGMQRQGIGGLVNMARGKQNLGQTLGSLGTSAAFRSAAPSIFKSAYDKGGMNGVYAAAAALQMAQRGAQRKVSGALGPGGGG
tara:strand:+ start:300 stop:983 length:684 start_codon:yes stop_codon:yes gene_type:complete